MPERIQLRRTKGWRMPEHTWSVARPGRWGNPFRVGSRYRWAAGKPCPYPQRDPADAFVDMTDEVVTCETAEQAVTWYRWWITMMVPSKGRDAVTCLAGWNLACWCPLDQHCHADVLLEIANATVAAGAPQPPTEETDHG